MAAQNQYTPEFREQAVRLVFESMEPDETRACAYPSVSATFGCSSAEVQLSCCLTFR